MNDPTPDEAPGPAPDPSRCHAQAVAAALAMGGEAKLAERRAGGLRNARERVEILFDAGTFHEIGLLATSFRPEMADRTPADGKVTGVGRVGGRPVAVVANDFTVLGASSSRTNSRKIRHLRALADRRRLPMAFLGESSGARMPDAMGVVGVAGGDDPLQYRRIRDSPWASGVLGPCYGSSAWYASMSDFVVMRKGAVLAVSGPRLTAMATSEVIDPEELGGWRVHAGASGLVDQVVATDDEAIARIRSFFGYLPGNNAEPPPVTDIPDGADDPHRAGAIPALLPTSRHRGYDMRRILEHIVDPGSLFDLKALYGRSLITALARIDGHPVGFVASNPLHKGGAIDPDACSKATSFLVLCDSFNVPLVFVADQPGFLVGRDGERKGATGRVMNWMNALALCTVPKIALVARKTYGQALLNMGLGGNADTTCAWTTAEIGFMEPEFGARIVYGERIRDDPERYRQAMTQMTAETSALAAAAAYTVDGVIEPADTRAYLQQTLSIHRAGGQIGQHLLRTWPTTVY